MVDQVTIKGYKSFKELHLRLGGLNLLIGSNGSGKSNFLSMFEMLNNAFEQRLANYVATLGGVDKMLFRGRKVTEQIEARLVMGHNSYMLRLLEADGLRVRIKSWLAMANQLFLCLECRKLWVN